MAVAFDTVASNGSGASVNGADAPITIANVANRFAILTLCGPTSSVSANSVTMGGLSFSLVSTVAYSTSLQAQTYVMYQPNTGSQSIQVVLQHSTSFIYMCSVFNGVDQASGYSLQYTATGSAAAATATFSTSTTDMLFASITTTSLVADSSATFTGITQNQTFNNGTYRAEHFRLAGPGTTATLAYAGVAGNAFILVGMNIKATSTTPVNATVYTLPQLGAGR